MTDESECWLHMWFFKEIEDILKEYKVDVLLTAHEH